MIAEFYVENFDLKIREASENGKWIDLEAGGFSIGLHGGGKPSKSSTSPKIAFYSKNLEATRKDLISKGVKLESPYFFHSILEMGQTFNSTELALSDSNMHSSNSKNFPKRCTWLHVYWRAVGSIHF